MQNIYESQSSNKRKSFIIMALFIVFITAVAYFISKAFDLSYGFLGIVLIISGLISFLSYWFSDKIILTISGAKPANKKDFFDFYTVTENLCLTARLPMPKLYVIEDSAMNAFATGRDYDHAVVCATTGLLGRLNRTETEGVIAHELSHIKNYDMLLMSIVTILVGFISLLSDILLRTRFRERKNNSRSSGQIGAVILLLGVLLALLSPLIAQLIKLAISRRREYFADASAIKLTRQPSGLISALKKLEQDREPLEAANKATAHLYIANPLKNHHNGVGWFANLFRTHPTIQKRVEALEKMF